ncbi:MAG: XRE family transcriptional regulator [Alphaproteobacteria bacterium]|nr:MAG: XRE family transcriptional regulator [Alphaproteobacteria bacterium]
MLQFGKNLRARARALHLTDAEVARRAGLNERRYGFYVTGDREPDLATLMKIAGVLQSTVDDLVKPGSGSTSPRGRAEAALLSAAKVLDDHHFALLLKTAEVFAVHQRKSGYGNGSTQHDPENINETQ